MSFVGCNGGAKDTNSLPKNVLSENWSTEGNTALIHIIIMDLLIQCL